MHLFCSLYLIQIIGNKEEYVKQYHDEAKDKSRMWEDWPSFFTQSIAWENRGKRVECSRIKELQRQNEQIQSIHIVWILIWICQLGRFEFIILMYWVILDDIKELLILLGMIVVLWLHKKMSFFFFFEIHTKVEWNKMMPRFSLGHYKKEEGKINEASVDTHKSGGFIILFTFCLRVWNFHNKS